MNRSGGCRATRSVAAAAALLSAALVPAACGHALPTGPELDVCAGYPERSASPYQLPYPVGVSYPLWQGTCSGQGHSGFWRYSYDFQMPIGSVVTAARGGTVIFTRATALDDGPHDANAEPNLVFIQRPGSDTMEVYSHLMHDGVRVFVGQVVQAGDTIALSGNTGYTANHPHLHFSVHACDSVPGFANPAVCPSLPMTFRNADPPDVVLLQGHTYRALPP